MSKKNTFLEKPNKIVVLVISALALIACQPSDAQVATAIAETQAAMPTDTPKPSSTPTRPPPTATVSPQPPSPTSRHSALSLAIVTSQSLPPNVSEGFLVETEGTVGISIARPAEWERDAGTADLPRSGTPVDYVVYFKADPGKIQTMSIQTPGVSYQFDSERDIIREVLGADDDRIAEVNLKVIDFADDVSVAGQPAQVVSYRLDDERSGLPLFSIILVIPTAGDNMIVLQWASNESMKEETTELFLNMLTTIRLIP